MSNAESSHRPPRRHPVGRGAGLAQQTLIEHALGPLDLTTALQPGRLHQVQYPYSDSHRNRKLATATVACPFGLSPHDELYLYGLLALTFAQPEPSLEFSATPHWCLKQLGIVEPGQEQGKRYQLFRDALRRLAGVVYENDRFYDPVRGEHRSVAFGLLKYSLPLDDESSRAWTIAWDPQWFRFCEAVAGSFTFDFGTYRRLDPASRRLFLLLSKIFWRSDQSPAFELRQLGIQTLGFSESLRTTEIKQRLIRIAEGLLAQEILALPVGISSPRELFTKQAKGRHVVQFHKGAYYDRMPEKTVNFTAAESPLVDPLAQIGFDRVTIQRLLGQYPRRLIVEWSDITQAAVERKLIKTSPQAYFQHYIREAAAQKTTPPDWWRELRKQERNRECASRGPSVQPSGAAAFEQYLRTEAADAFQQVLDRLFRELQDGGQPAGDARTNAEQFARVHFRRSFWEAHPEFRESETSSVSQLLQQRLPLRDSGNAAAKV